jgi:hypothetical protein
MSSKKSTTRIPGLVNASGTMSKSCSGGVRAGKARAASDEVVALAGCRVVRPSALAGAVEIVTASPEPRGFPTRVNEGLGLCLKLGPAHTVISDGRRASYPEDSVCVRDPGCVWSSEVAAVGFVSIDIAPAVLPRGLRYSPMRFLRPAALPDVRLLAQQLEEGPAHLQRDEALAQLFDALFRLGALRAEELEDGGSGAPGSERAREFLHEMLPDNPSLDSVAQACGMNKQPCCASSSARSAPH